MSNAFRGKSDGPIGCGVIVGRALLRDGLTQEIADDEIRASAPDLEAEEKCTIFREPHGDRGLADLAPHRRAPFDQLPLFQAAHDD